MAIQGVIWFPETKANADLSTSHNILWKNSYCSDMISVILYMYSLSLFFLTCARNTSSFETGNLIYIRPSALKVLVQPSDGEVGRELTVQPQLVFLDKQVPCAQVTILTWSWVVCCILCMFQIPPPSSRYMCPGCQPTL